MRMLLVDLRPTNIGAVQRWMERSSGAPWKVEQTKDFQVAQAKMMTGDYTVVLIGESEGNRSSFTVQVQHLANIKGKTMLAIIGEKPRQEYETNPAFAGVDKIYEHDHLLKAVTEAKNELMRELEEKFLTLA